MKLEVFASAWSFGSLTACLEQVRTGAFDGVEGGVPAEAEARRSFANELRASGIPFLAEACTGGDYAPASDVPEAVHFAQLSLQLEHAAASGAFLVTCLTGSDSWPLAQAIDYLGRALELARRVGVAACFETHRGRPLFNPWSTRDILRALPELELTCDFSHWCVVCERLLDDEPALLLAFERARHVHARVGYAQGPQVPDPRAPEYAGELARHERWWSAIWERSAARGFERISLTPEFGPDGYLHHAPFTNRPVADLASINTWMAARQRQRFEATR